MSCAKYNGSMCVDFAVKILHCVPYQVKYCTVGGWKEVWESDCNVGSVHVCSQCMCEFKVVMAFGKKLFLSLKQVK